MTDWYFDHAEPMTIGAVETGADGEALTLPPPASDADWLELLSDDSFATSSTSSSNLDVVITGTRTGGGYGGGGWYWDDEGWGDTSTYTDTTSEPALCEVTDDIGGIQAPDGATYRIPEGVTAKYLNDAIKYLQGIDDPVLKLAAFAAMFEDPNHPHFIDFKDWGSSSGPAGTTSPGRETYYSTVEGAYVDASAAEAFGNYFYGFCGVLGGISPEIIDWAAGAVQTGNELYERLMGNDDPRDEPHVAKGVQDALYLKGLYALNLPGSRFSLSSQRTAAADEPSAFSWRCSMIGLLASLLFVATSPQQSVAVIARFSETPVTGPGEVYAELIAVPEGTSAVSYADQLLSRDSLKPYGPGGRQSGRAGPLQYDLLDGRENQSVAIYSLAEEAPDQSRAVCRIRSSVPGLSEARGAANRWCASQLGVTLPERAVPFIGSEPADASRQ